MVELISRIQEYNIQLIESSFDKVKVSNNKKDESNTETIVSLKKMVYDQKKITDDQMSIIHDQMKVIVAHQDSKIKNLSTMIANYENNKNKQKKVIIDQSNEITILKHVNRHLREVVDGLKNKNNYQQYKPYQYSNSNDTNNWVDGGNYNNCQLYYGAPGNQTYPG